MLFSYLPLAEQPDWLPKHLLAEASRLCLLATKPAWLGEGSGSLLALSEDVKVMSERVGVLALQGKLVAGNESHVIYAVLTDIVEPDELGFADIFEGAEKSPPTENLLDPYGTGFVVITMDASADQNGFVPAEAVYLDGEDQVDFVSDGALKAKAEVLLSTY